MQVAEASMPFAIAKEKRRGVEGGLDEMCKSLCTVLQGVDVDTAVTQLENRPQACWTGQKDKRFS